MGKHIHVQTSSTAQGGGGSFKDRKPVREVRSCESWMAERLHQWIEKWLEAARFVAVVVVIVVAMKLRSELQCSCS